MKAPPTSDYLPGVFPLIAHREPSLTGNGKDNLGMGFTQHGEQFLLKAGGALGAAEFVGARVAEACGVPTCQPAIVTISDWTGQRQVFGSRIESGCIAFEQTNVAQWRVVTSSCTNLSAFSAMLAIDLVLGNDDRHWNNWLVQQVAASPTSGPSFRLRAVDFSRSWPTRHPAQHPLRHASPNTWLSTKDWELLGIAFEIDTFHATCVKIGGLKAHWLRSAVLTPILGTFITAADMEAYCAWWDQCLQQQVIETIHALENGVWP